MVLNDFDRDLRVLLAEENMSKRELAEKWGVAPQYITQVSKHEPVIKSFVKMIDALGYDISVEYIKKEE